MFYGDKVQDTRRIFFSSWEKSRKNQQLTPLEFQVAEVIAAHPEYHALLEFPERMTEQAYFPEMGETNPFLHMGLHLAIREQVATNRPQGIQPLYQQLVQRCGDVLQVEHALMEQLAECLWLAQRAMRTPDEQAYLRACLTLLQ